MNARRAVEFLRISDGGAAVVRWALEEHVVQLSELSRPQPAVQPQDVGLPRWFETPQPAKPPTIEALEDRLHGRREQLQHAHARAQDCQSLVERAKAIADRAADAVRDARATLAVSDQHQRAA